MTHNYLKVLLCRMSDLRQVYDLPHPSHICGVLPCLYTSHVIIQNSDTIKSRTTHITCVDFFSMLFFHMSVIVIAQVPHVIPPQLYEMYLAVNM